MDLNNDDEINRALTGEGEVSLVDKGFIFLQKIRKMMEMGAGVLPYMIHAFKMKGVEDSIVKKLEQAEIMLNGLITALKLVEKQDSTAKKVILLLIILMIPMLLYLYFI